MRGSEYGRLTYNALSMDRVLETQTRLERLSKRPVSNGEANMVVVTMRELRANHIVFISGGRAGGLHLY